MSALAVALLALCGAAHGEDSDLKKRFRVSLGAPVATYDGEFDRPPVPHFHTRLPGERLGAGSHSERGGLAVYGDLVFLGSAGSSALHAVSRRDGSLIRSYPAVAPVQSTPVLEGDRVYFTDKGGSTWCYQLDGTLVWRHEGVAPILARPTVTEDRVVVANVQDLVVSLSRETGELVWRYQRPPDLGRDEALGLFASPPPLVADGVVYSGFSDGFLMALDADSGDPMWETSVGEGEYPDLVAGIVAYGSDVYASGYFDPFAAIDIANEQVRWRVQAGSAATPLLDLSGEQPILYHPGSDGRLRAVVARTGEQLWEWDSGKTGALTDVLATPVGLLFGVSDGGVYLVDPETGEERWRYRGSRQLNGVTAAPTIAGRQLLFVTNAGALYSMLAPRSADRVSRRPWDSSL